MTTKIKLDPVTRLEGHMKIEVEIDSNNRVVDAKSTGNLFRGFENILAGRDPRDAVHITQRICGFCPVSQGLAAVKAIEEAEGFEPNTQAKLLRNLIEGASFLSNHILHFYHLSLLDYIKGPEKALWQSNQICDMRFNNNATQKFFENYIKALDIRRQAHEMCAIFAGKIPHAMSIMPGGVTKVPTLDEITQFKILLQKVKTFIDGQYHEDVQKLASVYKDYFNIGKGPGNFISYGVFDIENDMKLFRQARYTSGKYISVDIHKITEHVSYAWYNNEDHKLINGSTNPNPNKTNGYSWVKAPRYEGISHEAGPLARMWLNGAYRGGISVMDRHVARMLEAKMIANAMTKWIEGITANGKSYNPNLHKLSRSGSGTGITEAPRGALVHYLQYNNGVIQRYQIITPTCWNASPKDSNNQPGPMEEALIGTTIQDLNKPIELMRIVHSFDPCTACAVHVMTPEKQLLNKFVVSSPSS